METTKHIKYAGADWLRSSFEGKGISMSPLGVRVANVIGQVDFGIYHTYHDAGMNPKKVNWDGVVAIAATWPRPLATYDFSELTRLYLCCEKAELAVGLYGSFKGYTRLIFTPNPGGTSQDILDLAEPTWLNEDSTIKSLLLGGVIRWGKKLRDEYRGETWTCPGLGWHDVIRLVYIAHRTAHRIQVVGRSPQSLEVMITKRDRTDSVSTNHPTLDQAKQNNLCWDVDYGQ